MADGSLLVYIKRYHGRVNLLEPLELNLVLLGLSSYVYVRRYVAAT